MGNFQTEAAQKKQESEAAVSKLSSVRKLIAKLLKSINEVRAAVEGGGGGAVLGLQTIKLFHEMESNLIIWNLMDQENNLRNLRKTLIKEKL